jgi:transcriptional regulator GlxA family with amidase domain
MSAHDPDDRTPPGLSRRSVLASPAVVAAASLLGAHARPTAAETPKATKETNMANTSVHTVGILLFDEVEVLDYAGPYEVFWEARPKDEDADEKALFKPVTIAERAGPIRGRGGLQAIAQFSLTDHPPIDILVVPGGRGTRPLLKNPAVLDWLAAIDKTTALTTSVCTGAFLLAERGLLDGKRATTHCASVDWMRHRYPKVTMVENERFVDQGRIITAAGVSAGIDMALHVVARLHGKETADWTARRIQYDYWPAAGHQG